MFLIRFVKFKKNVLEKPWKAEIFYIMPNQVRPPSSENLFSLSLLISIFHRLFFYWFFLDLGKTAMIISITMKQLDLTKIHCSILVLCFTRDLASKISTEYKRFMPSSKIEVLVDSETDEESTDKMIEAHVIIGTPEIILSLARKKRFNFKQLKYFILDECDALCSLLGKFDHIQMTVP